MNKNILTNNDVMDMLNVPRNKASYYLYRMNKKKLIRRAKNGLYIFHPQSEDITLGEYLDDPIYLLKYLAKPYFASHYTALDLHGISQRWTNVYYFTTTKKVKRLKNKQYSIIPIITLEKYFFGFTQIEYDNEKIYVSDIERTILDILNRPEYAFGFEDAIKSILNIEKVEFTKLYNYLTKLNKKILFHRIGYLFDSSLFKKALKVPRNFLKNVRRYIHSVMYFNQSHKSGIFNKKWKVIIPLEIENLIERWL
ncbi:MAG: type IV toxin-antitoxin system AbiEi family antitoxin domain-containing protein [Candidatus Helarchaeota archaeon]